MKFPNIYSLFRTQVDKFADEPVFHYRRHGIWDFLTWRDFERLVHEFACALLASGLSKGASVAILAGNIPEWTIVDVATIAAGGIGVGIYPTSSPEQVSYIIDHSDAEIAFVDSEIQLEKIKKTFHPKLKKIVTLFEANVEGTVSFREFLSYGREHHKKFFPEIERGGFAAQANDIAIMVYTSGTTGKPKGAMLSHKYVLNSVESLRLCVPIFHDDVTLSYLPACHVAERISGIYNRLYNATPTYFIDDLSLLYDYMLEIKPTVFASLPRFFEKIYAKIIGQYGKNVDKEIVRNAFGGRVRLLTSGGAPLPIEIAEFFASAGLPILQAYGLTENVCVAFNTFRAMKFGTVGKPMPMCQVKIAPDGEILVKSDMMFSGYYKDPEKTNEMFDKEGWLKTGDIGELDEDGFLKITGRKKEIIVLSNGKKVSPTLIENMVKENHLISQCFVYGDNRSYCVALITLNETEVLSFAQQHSIACTNMAEMAKNEIILRAVKQTIENVNRRVSSPEQIKKFVILERDFSIERDEITPTLKIRREVVSKNFREEIEQLYAS